LFFSQPLSCFRCHGSFTLSGATDFDGRRSELEVEFHNTGLYNLALSYPPPDAGGHAVRHKLEDVGKFKAPTLRNIAVTAPYMHDGVSEPSTTRFSRTTPPAAGRLPTARTEAWATTTRPRARRSEAFRSARRTARTCLPFSAR
jgi:hypothetical protein